MMSMNKADEQIRSPSSVSSTFDGKNFGLGCRDLGFTDLDSEHEDELETAVPEGRNEEPLGGK